MKKSSVLDHSVPRADRFKSMKAAIKKYLERCPDQAVAASLRAPTENIVLDVNGDRIFHAASTVKLPIMLEIFRRVETGVMQWDDTVSIHNNFRSIVDGSNFHISEDSDKSLHTKTGKPVTVKELAELMITVSSNLAANLLLEIVGPESVQSLIKRLGTRNTRVLRGVEDAAAYDCGLNNTTTSSDLALLLTGLMTGHAISQRADSAMIDILFGQRFGDMIPAALPGDTRVAHKTGWTSSARHDAAIVYPSVGNPYVLVILTDGFSDRGDAEEVIRELTKIVSTHLCAQG